MKQTFWYMTRLLARKKRMFLFSLLAVAVWFYVVFFIAFSLDDLFGIGNAFLGTNDPEVNWQLYTALCLQMGLQAALLLCLSLVFLVYAWRGDFQLILVLLLWHFSFALLSSFGQIGQLLCYGTHSIFTDITAGLWQLAFLPLFFCIACYLKKRLWLLLGFVLVGSSFSVVLVLISTYWRDSVWYGFAVTTCNAVFLVSVLASVGIGFLEWRAKNESFTMYPATLVTALGCSIAVSFLLSSLAKRVGYVMQGIPSNASFSELLQWFCGSVLQPFFLSLTFWLIAVNTVRYYYRALVRARMVRLQDAANTEYAKNLRQYETQLRELKHDLYNSMTVCAQLCESKHFHRLQVYLTNVTDHAHKIAPETLCSNILVNYVLVMFRERFKKLGAEFRCTVMVPPDLALDDADLTSELNNILQNALDANVKMSETERWVDIAIRVEDSVLRIECRNPYAEEPIQMKNGMLRSSKTDEKGHGLGLSIIHKIAHRHGGVALPTYGDGIFTVKVAIPLD